MRVPVSPGRERDCLRRTVRRRSVCAPSYRSKVRPPPRGGTPLYKYVPPQRVWFLSCLGLKMGIDFDHYGLKSGMVFKGTTGAYKRICLFNSK